MTQIPSAGQRGQSPSILPTDRLDRDIHLVLKDFRAGAAWCETDEADTDVSTIINST